MWHFAAGCLRVLEGSPQSRRERGGIKFLGRWRSACGFLVIEAEDMPTPALLQWRESGRLRAGEGMAPMAPGPILGRVQIQFFVLFVWWQLT